MAKVKVLLPDGYLIVNREVLKLSGVDTAIYFACLEYLSAKDNTDDDWFSITHKQIENITNLTAYQQRNATKKLVKQGLISYELKGLPRRAYVKIND